MNTTDGAPPAEAGGHTLVCFALRVEAAPFHRLAASRPDIRTLLTGVGRRNSGRALQEAFEAGIPARVFTCGFAGGLDPQLTVGEVVFATESAELAAALLDSGARRTRFHCADRIAATTEEKKLLRESTGADAVEMESEIIHALCRERGISCATVRIISDTAHENLPLDFNEFMDARQELRMGKLIGAILCSPGKIGGLLKLQRQTRAAAEKLADVLARITVG